MAYAMQHIPPEGSNPGQLGKCFQSPSVHAVASTSLPSSDSFGVCAPYCLRQVLVYLLLLSSVTNFDAIGMAQ